MNKFCLDPAFSNIDYKIGELDLCYLYLNDNAHYPWVILIPKRSNISEIISLSTQEQHLLIDEISLVSKAMQELFRPDKLNIATLGNIVPQLHIHIIARYKNDLAWPQPVFGKESLPYNSDKRDEIIKRLWDSLLLLKV
jgi:diadenosine tetraphosphate (Ap4A) HIT family hydrolase